MTSKSVEIGLFAEKNTLAKYTASETNLVGMYLGIYMMGPKVGDFMSMTMARNIATAYRSPISASDYSGPEHDGDRIFPATAGQIVAHNRS